jgi:HEAT repeat protein
LAAALNDPDPHVRAVAVVSLGKTEAAPTEALPILLAMLNTDERLHAARTLGSYGLAAEPAVPKLRELLDDGELEVRLAAIEALGKIGAAAEQAVPDLIPLLGDESEMIREYAVEALGRIGDAAKPAIEAIVPLLEDNEAAVRAAAARTLRTLDPARFADLPAAPPPPSKPKS